MTPEEKLQELQVKFNILQDNYNSLHEDVLRLDKDTMYALNLVNSSTTTSSISVDANTYLRTIIDINLFAIGLFFSLALVLIFSKGFMKNGH